MSSEDDSSDAAALLTCSEVVSTSIVLPSLLILLLIFLLALSVWYSRRTFLIGLYADPRNTVVTFRTSMDLRVPKDERDQRSSKRSKHRDVLEESTKIHNGTDGADSGSRHFSEEFVPKPKKGAGGSQIFLKNPSDPGNLHNKTVYQWEIDFTELNLESKVGGGQYGDVYRGVWLDTEVAVKIPKTDIDEKELVRFCREVKLMSILHHPNIVLFLGACITSPNICLVMEYLSGGNLFDYINSEVVKGGR
ncbi:hypothetical protein TeGR_g12249 [Tetraparma gracilis]|uniref:Protein kinase domain-containing protein n=1 Tax=Tetraparma gracilis TaxID=2962635 RepID=A0ABQ6N4Y4_9STRA|nr:hypothetical protein TeGR_g12249 [Tetraparma gracilis]